MKRQTHNLLGITSDVETLRTNEQFERVRREGRSWSSPLLVLNAARNATGELRFGFITGKKLGNAVKRNHARRLVKEAVRLRLPLLQTGWDLVWVARAPVGDARYEAVARAVDDLLKRAKLFLPDILETAP